MQVVYFTTKTSFLVCFQTVFFFFLFERFFKEVPDIFVDKSMTKSILGETWQKPSVQIY